MGLHTAYLEKTNGQISGFGIFYEKKEAIVLRKYHYDQVVAEGCTLRNNSMGVQMDPHGRMNQIGGRPL
jgi:hypothetical protein